LSSHSGSSVSLQQLRYADIRTSGGREEVRLNRSNTGRSEIIAIRFTHKSTPCVYMEMGPPSYGTQPLAFFNGFIRAGHRFKIRSFRRQTMRERDEFRRLQQAETNSEIGDAWRDSIERGDALGNRGMSHVENVVCTSDITANMHRSSSP